MRVWSLLGVVFVMSLRGECFCGETNNCADRCIEFSMPPMHLRAEPGPGTLRVEAAAVKTVSSPSVVTVQSENTLNDLDFRSRVFRSDRFYLTQPKALPDSGVARFVDMVFTPEVAQVGRVSVSSPILTVVKRKNPLCLLSAFATDRGLLTFNLLELSW